MDHHHDIEELAYLAIIGVCLVLIGALLTAGPVSIEQRGTVLGGIIVVLFTVGWRARRRRLARRGEREIEDDDGEP